MSIEPLCKSTQTAAPILSESAKTRRMTLDSVREGHAPSAVGNCTPMSEAIQPEQPPYPGEAWTEIVRRPTLEEFSRAFASDVVLEASVVSRPMVGPIGLWAFFQATRAMYERIGFTHEIGTKARTCLEWKGSSPASRWLARRSLHGTTTGRSRACDCIIARSIRSSHSLKRFRGVSAEAGGNVFGRAKRISGARATSSLSEQ
jgi:hypothetical protein